LLLFIGKYIELPSIYNNTSDMTKQKEKVIKLAKKIGIIRPRDILKQGIAAEYLKRLTREGVLEKRGRGLYILKGTSLGEHYSTALVAKQVPEGVLCLLSALAFHGLTTQSPHEVWIALDNKSWQPKVDTVSLRLIRYSGKSFSHGVEKHIIGGVPLKVYCIPKTIADCFKFRNKIGLDVAIEALREGYRLKKCTIDQVWYFSKMCRVTRIIQPYMEMLE